MGQFRGSESPKNSTAPRYHSPMCLGNSGPQDRDGELRTAQDLLILHWLPAEVGAPEAEGVPCSVHYLCSIGASSNPDVNLESGKEEGN
jgi:hypothetical protein